MKIIKSKSASQLTNTIISAKKKQSAAAGSFQDIIASLKENMEEVSDTLGRTESVSKLDAKLQKAGFSLKLKPGNAYWELKGVPTSKLMASLGKLLGTLDGNASTMPSLVDISEKNNDNYQTFEDYEIGVGMSKSGKLYVEINF